jgi:hypothetical protein
MRGGENAHAPRCPLCEHSVFDRELVSLDAGDVIHARCRLSGPRRLSSG